VVAVDEEHVVAQDVEACSSHTNKYINSLLGGDDGSVCGLMSTK